jgi:hypothetical protein
MTDGPIAYQDFVAAAIGPADLTLEAVVAVGKPRWVATEAGSA